MDDAMADAPGPAPAATAKPKASRAKPKVSRKRRPTESTAELEASEQADRSAARKIVRVKKETLGVFQALDAPFNTPFPASLLVVAPTASDAKELALQHSPVKGSPSLENRMTIIPIDTHKPTVAFPGMGGPITPLRNPDGDSADGTAPKEMQIFMFEDFPWFDYVPAVAVVVAPDQPTAHQMLEAELMHKGAPLHQQSGEWTFTLIEVKPGIVVTLSTGLPAGMGADAGAGAQVWGAGAGAGAQEDIVMG